ncbi:cytochrome P450 [Maioricimonas sp. JC845]|uniref:cytochrome P450 n=1 Tax=Maioricimonas sp. JC845 TaxID=3232138 RepID=UPI00345981C4
MSRISIASDHDSSDALPVSQGRIADFADDPVVCMRRLWARHGEVAALEEGTQRIHFVFGPHYTKQVLSDATTFHSRFFALRGPRRSSHRRVTSGLLSMNGDEHRRHRRMVMQPFQKSAIGAYHETVCEVADELVSGWQPGQLVDINAEMTRYMLRLTSRILFGLDNAELAEHVGELTERWVALNHALGPAAFSADDASTDLYEELLAAAGELEVAAKEMIRSRRDGKPGSDVLSLLLRAHDEQGGITDEQLMGHIVLLFGAAHLTSAHTLTWTLLLLAQHPDVMRQLHEELTTVVGDREPRQEDLDALPYLDRVLKESMRVLPASSYSQRVAAEPTQLGPFSLAPGAVVIFSQFITHHLPELYAEPERFLPDRWLDLRPSPYAYLPFGAGPRMCIGAALGMMQLKISLPSLLRRFKFSLVPGATVNARVMSTMLFPTTSVPMRIESQDGQFTSQPIGGNIHTLVDFPSVSGASPIRKAA